MAATTVTLNVGTGGAQTLFDTLTTVDGAAAPASAVTQLVKYGFGIAGDFKTVTTAQPLPVIVPDTTASGSLAAANAVVSIPLNDDSGVNVEISGTWAGTIVFEGTVGGTVFNPLNGVSSSTSAPSSSTTVNGLYRLTPAAVATLQVRMSVFTSGSATIAIRASGATGGIFANQILPTKVNENGIVSTLNSTAVNLAAAGVFTGTFEDIGEFSTIMVSVFSSHASATDGLVIQQSSDGVNADLTDSYSIPATTGKTFSFGVQAKFYRLMYTNGATLTTALRIQTLLSKTAKKFSSVRPQDGRSNDNDFEEVLAYGMLYAPSGVWERARGDATNGARTQLTSVTTATVLSVANTAATLTIAAAGAGLFHYLTRIRITMHNTSAAAVAGSAVTLAFTSTNIPTGLAWTEGNALAAGASKTVVDESMPNGIKTSTAATATTIVAPATGLGVLVRITAYYFIGP